MINRHFRASVGAWVRAHRESQQETQEELARGSGLTAAAVSHIECGRRLPTVDKLVAIARHLHVSLDDLFLMKGSP